MHKQSLLQEDKCSPRESASTPPPQKKVSQGGGGALGLNLGWVGASKPLCPPPPLETMSGKSVAPLPCVQSASLYSDHEVIKPS